jgi:two-component system phosphate regulon sensor histidine kinase PhoR
MHIGFRAKVFLSVATVAAAAVLVAALLFSLSVRSQVNDAIRRSLVEQAHLVAGMLAHHQEPGDVTFQEEADSIGSQVEARVTLIAADGRVVGDSEVPGPEVGKMENHASRPEVVMARERGLGIERRFSHTLGKYMLYVAVPVRHPDIAIVRLALPLTDVAQQLGAIRHATLVALAVALAAAMGLAWLSSHLLGRRVNAIAAAARAYASGDMSHPALDYEDDQLGTVARVLDDTVRELAGRMREITEDSARLEAILTGMLEGVLVVDASGRLQLVNGAARQMLKLDDGAVGKSYLESIRHPGIVAILGQALAGRQADQIEFQPARSPRNLVARATPVAAPSATGAVLVLHDVTELRRADQVRRDFVANVSHELRTPLTAIRGYVEALGEEQLEAGEREQFLAVIERQTGRMERLVKDLLRLASLDAREEPLDVVDCSLPELVGHVVRDLSPSLEQKDQQVLVDIAPGLGPVTLDAAKLQDALRNIVDNASSYSPASSTIDISAERDGEHLVLRVADRGPGIPEADLERVFERFYRVDKARSRESGGTGLGLSIVKHLVFRLSGEVKAGNRPGGGAVFTVRLPYREGGGR